MKAKIIILTITLILTISAIISINSFADERVEKIKSSAPYVLKKYENCVAVYQCDELVRVFETVNYSALPEYDKNILKNGMSFSTLNEIYSVIEDFDG